MKICSTKEIKANVYNLHLKFMEYGSDDMTAKAEAELVDDFAPSFFMKDIEFKGKYKYDKDKKEVVEFKDTTGNGVENNTEKPTNPEEEPDIGEISATITDPEGNVVVQEDTGEFVEVSIRVNDKEVIIDDKLELKCVVREDQILDSELGQALNSKSLVAQAKVQLFEDKIVDKIREVLGTLKDQRTNFEKAKEIII